MKEFIVGWGGGGGGGGGWGFLLFAYLFWRQGKDWQTSPRTPPHSWTDPRHGK